MFTYPPRNVVSRGALAPRQLWLRLRGTEFRTFAHSPGRMSDIVRRAGFEPYARRRAASGAASRWLAQTEGYDRHVAVTTGTKLDAHTLRKDFPIFEQEFHGKPLAYLDSAASAQKPRQMLKAMEAFYETSYANVHRGVYELAERATEGLETAREKVRVLLNAPAAREVIFVRNATEGINLVAYAWGFSNLGPGDVVLVTELEHHSNFVPWQYVAKRTGAEFRMIPLTDEGDLVLDGLDELVGRGSTQGRRPQSRVERARHRQRASSRSPSGHTGTARSS